jgi:hypothetical protein
MLSKRSNDVEQKEWSSSVKQEKQSNNVKQEEQQEFEHNYNKTLLNKQTNQAN